jgi:hypothetical protein
MHESARRPSSCGRPPTEWSSTPRHCRRRRRGRSRLAQTASPVMSGQSRGAKILPRESAVPSVGHDATFRHEVPAPGVGSAVQPAMGGIPSGAQPPPPRTVPTADAHWRQPRMSRLPRVTTGGLSELSGCFVRLVESEACDAIADHDNSDHEQNHDHDRHIILHQPLP